MHKPRRLRLMLPLAVLLIILLTVTGAMLSTKATAHAASKKAGISAAQVFGARPLWKDAYQLPKTVNANTAASLPTCLTSAVPPRCYSPAQIRRAYNVQSLLKEGITGKGRTIVLIDGSSSPTLQADVHLFDLLYGLKDPTINVIAPSGFMSYDPNAYTETALDVEWSHALAPDATIDLVVADTSNAITPGDFVSILLGATKYAVDHNLGDVISQSYGVGESCVGSAYLQEEHQIFAEAQAKHITVLASAGDSGALQISCNAGQFFEAKGVSIPSSDPLVTAVGGTSLDANVTNGSYNAEVTWNEWNAGDGATGGGFSSLFATPNYQQSVPGIGATRGVPDVAFDADPLTGVPVVLSIQGATYIVPFGGTSVGSPVWAGIVALANQYAGHRLGFLNDRLYKILKNKNYSKAFHDITLGDNTVTLFDQNGNPVPVPGYNAGSGWDAVTGLGTPKVNNLVNALSNM